MFEKYGNKGINICKIVQVRALKRHAGKLVFSLRGCIHKFMRVRLCVSRLLYIQSTLSIYATTPSRGESLRAVARLFLCHTYQTSVALCEQTWCTHTHTHSDAPTVLMCVVEARE